MSGQPLTPEQVGTLLEKLPQAAGARLAKALDLVGTDHIAAVINRFGRGSDGLRNHSRHLIDSLGHRVIGQGGALDDLQLVDYSAGATYARIQEYGGDVAPKNVKNLTIPQKAALKPSGEPRFTARELLNERKDAFFLKDKRGRVWLVAPKKPTNKVRTRGAPGLPGPNAHLTDKNLRRPQTTADLAKRNKGSRDLEFYFLLVPHAVYVPPRLRFFQTWKDLQSRRVAILSKALQQAVADTAGGAA